MDVRVVHPADLICQIMERIYDMDMTSLTGGNISMMDEEGVMWVTPTSIDKKSLTRDDIVRVLPDGTIEGRHKPTSEYYIHRSILTKHPDIKAVIHAHAPATVTMSVLNRVPDTKLYLPAYEVVGEPMMTPYALPGSMRLVDRVMEAFDAGYDGAILEKHSAFIGSRVDLLDAFHRFEALDFASRIEINSYDVGIPRPLAKEQLENAKLPDTAEMPEYVLEKHSAEELNQRRWLCSVVKRGYGKKLFTSANGVMSVRTGEDSFLIPERGVDNGLIRLEDVMQVKEGKREAGRIPNAMATLHEKIYKLHPEIQSIITAAPVYTMGFLVTDTIYDTTLYPESYGVLCEAKRYKFEDLFENMDTIAENIDLQHPMAMIENYGVVLAGISPILAFDKLEVCESSAQSIHEMKRMGLEPILMTPEQIAEMNG